MTNALTSCHSAQKQFGKQPPQTPLPPASENRQAIEFLAEEQAKPAEKAPERTERVRDEQLKALIAFEEQADNRVVVPEQVSKHHPFVRQTKEAFTDRFVDRGLCHPSWSGEGARLSIKVGKESIPRALRLMDTLIKAFEDRGHKVVFELKEHRKEVYFLILGEKLSLQLREKTKMIRVSEAESKKSYSYNRVNYEPTGLFELQLHGSTYSALATWKDGVRAKLEDQLNEVLIALIVGVESERDWRKRQEENERQSREAERKRWQQEDERRKEQQKIQELEQMMDRSDKAMRIRGFMQEVRRMSSRRKDRSRKEANWRAGWTGR